jgi:hypothetical protein
MGICSLLAFPPSLLLLALLRSILLGVDIIIRVFLFSELLMPS